MILCTRVRAGSLVWCRFSYRPLVFPSGYSFARPAAFSETMAAHTLLPVPPTHPVTSLHLVCVCVRVKCDGLALSMLPTPLPHSRVVQSLTCPANTNLVLGTNESTHLYLVCSFDGLQQCTCKFNSGSLRISHGDALRLLTPLMAIRELYAVMAQVVEMTTGTASRSDL